MTRELPHPITKWDVYRDKDGNPITITPEQCAMLQHTLRVWLDVARMESYSSVPAIEALMQAFYGAIISKSCLMGRMLYDGKAPFDDAPPTYFAAPIYGEWERENHFAELLNELREP